MNRLFSPMDQVNLIGKLADLKEQHYRQALLIGALTELLLEKGLLTPAELESTLARLDRESLPAVTRRDAAPDPTQQP